MANNYLSAELHANGETVSFDTAKDAMSLYKAFRGNSVVLADHSKEYLVNNQASEFAVFTIDQTATPLADKPNCNNIDDCPSDSSSVSESNSNSGSDAEG